MSDSEEFISDGLIAARVAVESERSLKKAKLHTEIQNLVCPHCRQLLNVKTYKRHENLYRKDDGSWIIQSQPPELTLEGTYSYSCMLS